MCICKTRETWTIIPFSRTIYFCFILAKVGVCKLGGKKHFTREILIVKIEMIFGCSCFIQNHPCQIMDLVINKFFFLVKKCYKGHRSTSFECLSRLFHGIKNDSQKIINRIIPLINDLHSTSFTPLYCSV